MADARLVFLDGCRGVAALIVVLLHASTPFWPKAMIFANLAVDFFFMLSAFVLMHAYADRIRAGLGLKRFLYIRWLRLFPLHATGLLLGLLLFAGRYGFTPEAVFSFALNLVFLPSPHVLAEGWPSAFGLNIPAWSLAFEWLANLLLILVFVRLSPRTMRYVTAVVGVLYAAQLLGLQKLWAGGSFDDLHLGVLRVLYPFSLGICLWHAWKAGPATTEPPHRAGMLLALLIAVLLAPSGSSTWNAAFMFCAISLAFPLIIRIGANVATRGHAAGIMLFLGHISYGLYVTHAAVLRVFTTIWRTIQPDPALLPLLMLIETALAVLLAWLLTRWFDAPARAGLKRWKPA